MLLVVCDSSPLIYLSRLGRFELLRTLFEQVLVPPAVWSEVTILGKDRPGANEVKNAASEGWLRVVSAERSLAASSEDLEDLDPGEVEAIQLALESRAVLAIDEAKGRDFAASPGITIIGTVGMLVRAKSLGLVPSLRAELDRLRSETAFRISDRVYQGALNSVGENS